MNSRIYILGALCWAVVSGAVAVSNTLDYTEAFESYADGFSMPGTNGWSAAAFSNAVVSSDETLAGSLNAYGAPCGYPLPAESHGKVLELGVNGTVTNQFDMAGGQVVWVDYMALPVHGPLPSVADGVAGMQAAVAFDLDGHPAILHYDPVAGSNRWSVVENMAVQPWDWVRITMEFDFQTNDPVNHKRYFQVRLNGILLTHSNAWTANDGTGVPGGSWFAVSSEPDRFSRLVSRVDRGIPAALDDLVVATGNPLAREITIGSPLGQADPGVGTHIYTYGDTVSLAVTNPVFEQGTSRFVLSGWTMDGHEPFSGTDAAFQITLTNDLLLTWLWSTNNTLAPLGTPEWWLESYGLTNASPAEEELLDGDADGVPAWEEWICDTAPDDGNSVLEYTAIEPAGNGVRLYWKGGVLATQVLENCTDLVSGNWKPLFTNIPPTSVSTNFNDAGADASGFYRIKVSR